MSEVNVHSAKKDCKREVVSEKVCHLSFASQKEDVVKAMIVSAETVRGETLVLELNKDGKIIGVDIFAPGMKPCQPLWEHNGQ